MPTAGESGPQLPQGSGPAPASEELLPLRAKARHDRQKPPRESPQDPFPSRSPERAFPHFPVGGPPGGRRGFQALGQPGLSTSSFWDVARVKMGMAATSPRKTQRGEPRNGLTGEGCRGQRSLWGFN